MDFYLQKAIFYQETNLKGTVLPFEIQEKEEYLHFYEINPRHSNSIEPAQRQFLGDLVFIGKKSSDETENGKQVALPKGNYLFTQQRSEKPLSQADWLNLAIEQQKDGLWERNKLENSLYIRFLFEDGKAVTQIFRPVQSN